ncbi:MAG: MFS transporter [Patescibacteria group bacterium]
MKQKNKSRLALLCLLGLFLALSAALPAYLQSNFLEQFVDARTMSLFFIAANILTIFALRFFPLAIKNLTNYFTAKIVLILYGAALLGLAASTSAGLAFFSLALFIISSNLVWVNMDIFVESFSANSATGRIRTIYFSIMNVGWILAPTLSAYLIGRGGYSLAFLIAGFLVIPLFIIVLRTGHKLRTNTKYSRASFGSLLKKIRKDKNLRGIFFVALLLQLFYSTAVIYIPVYLHQTLNMGWSVLGPIFSIMLIPFILFQIPAGIIADKYLGEKEILSTGLVILVISLFLFYYINIPLAWLWALVLFFSRIGAALVEAMRESYFFKIVDVKDMGLINLFRMTQPLAYIIGPGLAILSLSFLPLNSFFLLIGLIMLSGFFFIYPMKDTR